MPKIKQRGRRIVSRRRVRKTCVEESKTILRSEKPIQPETKAIGVKELEIIKEIIMRQWRRIQAVFKNFTANIAALRLSIRGALQNLFTDFQNTLKSAQNFLANFQTPEHIRLALGYAVLVVVGVFAVQTVTAAEWQEPTQQPPAGNPPGFVWTSSPGGLAQTGGQFNIAGGGKLGGLMEALAGAVFGSAVLDLGSAAGGQNVIYGAAKASAIHNDDSLLLLQTAGDTGTMTDRLRVDGSGNVTAAGNLTAVKNVSAGGCVGPVFVGATGEARNGGLSGYAGANSICVSSFTGSHLCAVDEVLQSINCGAFSRVGTANGTAFWVSGGPAGYTTPANDCRGWTSSAGGDERGRFWAYDGNGGSGWLTSCNIAYKLGCCR